MKKREFVVGMHLKPTNCSKSLESFFLFVGITQGKIDIAYEQNPRFLMSSNFGFKKAKQSKLS